jgi:hypothetical protein
MPETYRAVYKRQDNKLEKLLHLVGDLFEKEDNFGGSDADNEMLVKTTECESVGVAHLS